MPGLAAQTAPTAGSVIVPITSLDDDPVPAQALVAAIHDINLIEFEAAMRQRSANAIATCDHVFASPLHGLIVAMPNGVPKVCWPRRGSHG